MFAVTVEYKFQIRSPFDLPHLTSSGFTTYKTYTKLTQA
jgi:hypothetical protein